MKRSTLLVACSIAASGASQAAVCGTGTIDALQFPSGGSSKLLVATAEMPQPGWTYASGDQMVQALEFRWSGDAVRWVDRVKLLMQAHAERSRVKLTSTSVYCTGTVDEWTIEIEGD